jgi:hypothetical protein
MHLVTRAAGTRRNFARHGMLEQVRDLGRRLEYVFARYDHLVRDLSGNDIPSPDFESRVQIVNKQIGDVADRLQDLFVLEYEAHRAEAYAAFGKVPSATRKAGTVVATPRRPRRTSIERMAPVVNAGRLSEAAEPPALSAAQ